MLGIRGNMPNICFPGLKNRVRSRAVPTTPKYLRYEKYKGKILRQGLIKSNLNERNLDIALI